MKNMTCTLIVSVIIVFAASTLHSQTPPQVELPKVNEAVNISIAFGNQGIGRVMGADERGKVQQYLEIWLNESKEPNVITYLLVGTDGKTFTATWGKGPINAEAFRCKPETIPEFGEKIIWAATARDGVLTFQEIQDGDIKGLFGNILQARKDYGREANASNQRTRVNYTEQNILGVLKEKYRKKWLERGWLQPANMCVRHF